MYKQLTRMQFRHGHCSTSVTSSNSIQIQLALHYSRPSAFLTGPFPQLSSPQIAFHLSFLDEGDRDVTPLAWGEVDAVLQSAPFDGPIVDSIAGRMSQCHDRGILPTSERKKRAQKSFGMGADNR